MISLWLPSPCERLSRSPTTMKPPTLPMFLFPTARKSVAGQPPTFTRMDSTKEFRWRLSVQPNRSLRLPTGDGVSQVYPSHPFFRQDRLAEIGCYRQALPYVCS